MSTKHTAEFTIRETTYYTGTVEIDAAEWQEQFGAPFDETTATIEQVQEYVDGTGADVHESNADVDGQEWSDLDVTPDEEAAR